MAWMDDVVVVGDGDGTMDNGDGDSNGNRDGDDVMDNEGRRQTTKTKAGGQHNNKLTV